ncbi:MAG: hypothetical protein IKO93_20970 [Lentisphaeria bacterium]|nr:hypothetical protein [Lentisphaeria bacterium]
MKVKCPYCGKTIEIPESTKVQHYVLCTFCGKNFFAAGELVFRYAKKLDLFRGSKEKKVACPYCGQHFKFDFQPLNNMLGCSECLKVFVLPPNELLKEVLPSTETIVISTVPLRKPPANSVFAKNSSLEDEKSSPPEKEKTPDWVKDPIPVPPRGKRH